LTTPEDRQKALEILEAGLAAGARAQSLASLLGIGLSTLQRWRRQFAGDADGVDRRKGSHRVISHRLTEEERQRILLTCNQPEFAALPPGQIVPILADPPSASKVDASPNRTFQPGGLMEFFQCVLTASRSKRMFVIG
jgi:transposase-like protein